MLNKVKEFLDEMCDDEQVSGSSEESEQPKEKMTALEYFLGIESTISLFKRR